MKSYRVLRSFYNSFLCGTPIFLTAGEAIKCDDLAAKYIETIQPLTLELIGPTHCPCLTQEESSWDNLTENDKPGGWDITVKEIRRDLKVIFEKYQNEQK